MKATSNLDKSIVVASRIEVFSNATSHSYILFTDSFSELKKGNLFFIVALLKQGLKT
jgi:hypothetical protein